MKKLINKIKNFCNKKAIAAKTAIQSVKAEGYVDTGVKIIISVVVGGVILAGLYAFIKNNIQTRLNTEIGKMFNYSGT